jgi:hypothetical protein
MSNAKATIAQATAAAKSTINAAKSRAKAKAEAETVDVKDVPLEEVITKLNTEQDDVSFSYQAFVEALRGRIGISWKRELTANVVACVVAFAGGFIGGIVMNICFAAVAQLTGSLFLAWAVWFIAAIGVIYASAKAGQAVGRYIAFGDIDRDIKSVKDKVSSFFKRAPKAPLEAA